MDRHIRITAWIAVAFAVSGAFLLFPIGTPALNFLFVIVKICMVAGLLTLSVHRQQEIGIYGMGNCQSVCRSDDHSEMEHERDSGFPVYRQHSCRYRFSDPALCGL
ncbi:MAG: hypothetical protein LKM41_11830 [Lachnospiraceae bacterium]|jgi:hypothetical protein|nr:hypothetical protein [Lachnospiraceae bacterium]